jgi:hypothetical protein
VLSILPLANIRVQLSGITGFIALEGFPWDKIESQADLGVEPRQVIVVDISESLFGKGTAGRAFEIFFEIEGFLPVTEGDGSFYAPGFVFRSMMNIPGIMCL